MRVGVISNDGVAASGLVTVLDNVIELGHELGVVEFPVPTDLGFSWRPDKPRYLMHSLLEADLPRWMIHSQIEITSQIDEITLALELTEIKASIARYDSLSPVETEDLRIRIDTLATIFSKGIERWLETNSIEWVLAINMTLPHAAPITEGLHRAIRSRFSRNDKWGGVLFWDHDLLGSCGIKNPDTRRRELPVTPNEFTPLPFPSSFSRWIVISRMLAAEAARYPTNLTPKVVPNILTSVSPVAMGSAQFEFARHHDLDLRRPIVLNPVRVYNPKGVHIAIRLLAEMIAAAKRRGVAVPYLLIFGSMREDPLYAKSVQMLAHSLNVDSEIRFLDGVPYTTHRTVSGEPRLNERELLKLSIGSYGGIIFTPSVPDYEAVGLGLGIAAVARLPCAVTEYNAFEGIYGSDYEYTPVSNDRITDDAERFLDKLQRFREADPVLLDGLAKNQQRVTDTFPVGPWRDLWSELLNRS
jgi:hypothetical protein